MRDGRSNRKANVIQFLSMLDKDCQQNFTNLVSLAQNLKLDGFEDINWQCATWIINSGRLLKLSGKNATTASLLFNFSPKLGGQEITKWWSDLIKALLVLRFHRKHQSTSNQRNFITAAGYVAHAAMKTDSQVDRKSVV